MSVHREIQQASDLLIIQPALEPNPRWVRRFGRFAAFLYVRWSTIGCGVEVLTAGAALIVGPVMVGICHIDRQLNADSA